MPNSSYALLNERTSSHEVAPENVSEPTSSNYRSSYGLLLAAVLLGGWAMSLTVLLSTNITAFPKWLLPVAVLWQAFFYTGLFITAHDAMHGSVAPGNPVLNTWVGRVAVIA